MPIMPTNANVNSIAAFFQNELDAENAIRELKKAGFRADQIGCSLEDYDLETDRRARGERGFWDKITDFFSGDSGYEDRNTGAGDGSRLEGRAIGRTLTIPDDYRDRIDEGGAFVAVYGENAGEAENILVRNRGEIVRDLNRFASAADYDNAERLTREEDFDREGDHRIELLSEVLRVRKDRIQRGEVRLRKEVVTETQNVQVPVTREELVVERIPGEGREADAQIGNDEEIRVPLTEERARVEKVPVVREKVNVGKRAVESTRNISDQTRREELRVDKEGEIEELDEKEVKTPRRKKSA